MTNRVILAGAFLLIGAAAFAPAKQSNVHAYKSTGDGARIFGTISFRGIPPKPARIDMRTDFVCGKYNATAKREDVVIIKDRIANVMVYVKGDPLQSYDFETPKTPVVIARRRCQPVPHVVGIQVGQILSMTVEDGTIHNTNMMTVNNQASNNSMMLGDPPLTRTFSRPEIAIPVRDNQHAWERAYIFVFSHPFFFGNRYRW